MRRAVGLSLAAGAWSALWVVLPLLAYAGLDARATEALSDVLKSVAARIGSNSAGVVAAVACVVFIGITIASALNLALIAYLDPGRRTLDALWWVRGTLRCAAWWLLAVAVTAAIAWTLERSGGHETWPWALPIAVYAAAPFLCFRGDIVSRERPPALWMPQWPRVTAIILLLLWFATSACFELATAFSMEISNGMLRWLAVIASELIGWVAGLLVATLAITAFHQRIRWTEGRAFVQKLPIRSSVIALAAVDLRLLWVLIALLLAPVISISVHSIFVIPQVTSSLEALGLSATYPLDLFIQLVQWTSEWWWLAVLPLTWPVLAWSARVVHLVAIDSGARRAQ